MGNRQHHRRTWTVQWHSPDCASMHPYTCYLGPTRVQIVNGISIALAIFFAQLTAERHYTLQWAIVCLSTCIYVISY